MSRPAGYFTGRLVTEQFGDWDVVRARFRYDGIVIAVIPEDFITDWASFPCGVRSRFPPRDPRWAPAAVLHDFLYERHQVPREVADLAFYEAMAVPIPPAVPTPRHLRWTFYRAVHRFGQAAYDSAPARQQLRLEAYQRLLARRSA